MIRLTAIFGGVFLICFAMTDFGLNRVAAEERVLFEFDNADSARQWQAVNDGVMGGRSDGRFRINAEKRLEFFGTLSLENNGGFASVRTTGRQLGLEQGDSIVLRVRGDGRKYTFNLYTPDRRMAFSYRVEFDTTKDTWVDIELPLSKFQATSFGNIVRNQPLNPSRVTGVGILLGDKKPGAFKLEIESINVSDGKAPSPTASVQKDVAYVDSGSDLQKLDIYSPATGNSNPIVIWIHGGGWRNGDKESVQLKPEAFNANGFVFISVNYRFIPEVSVEQMTADVAKAVKWTVDHAAEFSGDPKKLFVMGHSAGAHLAALVCTDGSYLEAEGLPLSTISGCVPIDTAAYDVPTLMKDANAIQKMLYTSAFGNNAASQRKLSPLSHVANTKGIPPFLILHVADRADSRQQSEAFAKRLVDSGVDASIVSAAGKTHASINRDLGKQGDPATPEVFDFLNKLLRE